MIEKHSTVRCIHDDSYNVKLHSTAAFRENRCLLHRERPVNWSNRHIRLGLSAGSIPTPVTKTGSVQLSV